MLTAKDLVLDWRLHLSVLAITLICEAIGVIVVPIGIGSILLLPLLYAFVLGLLINPNVVKRAGIWLKDRDVEAASPLIIIAIMPFIAKFGTIIGPSMDKIVAAGPALILQELGNLGTIVLAFPVAVLVLRMGREAIGACFSVAREPNIAIIADKYGLKSDEGAGVMGVYVIGTLFGTFIFAILASLLATSGAFSIEALAMACGIVEGLELGKSAHAALISRGFAEMTRLAVAMGGQASTLAGLCGLGDLVLTCSSVQSRNMSFGKALGEGRTAEEILGERNSVTEGVATAPALMALAEQQDVDMPICRAVDDILSGRASLDSAITALLSRPFTQENL